MLWKFFILPKRRFLILKAYKESREKQPLNLAFKIVSSDNPIHDFIVVRVSI